MNATRLAQALPSGRFVGPCRIEGEPSQWGFCLVYPALHEPTGRRVTLHELLPEELVNRGEDGAVSAGAASAEEFAWAREQFVEEGRRLGQYAGASLQRLIAVLQENGTAYWVTAPDEPRTLKQWLQERGRTPAPAEFQPLFLKLIDAVEEAHAHQILHFNLKPESVQMTPEGEPLLAHFAVARQAIARRSHDAGMATVGYSAPEQYDPAQPENERTDIYALGAIGYRAITGEPPPDAERRLAGERYVKLAGRFPAWPQPLLGAIDAALNLEPKARPPSIAAWKRRLERPPLGVWVAAHPRVALAGALAIAVLLTLLAIWIAIIFFHPPKPPKPEKEKTAQEEKAQGEEKENVDEKRSPEERLAEEQKAAKEKAAQAATERIAAEQRVAEAAEAARLATDPQAKSEAQAAAAAAAKKAEEARAAQALAEQAAAQARAPKDLEEGKRAAAEQARREQLAREVAREAAAREAAAKEAAAREDAKRQAGATPAPSRSTTGWSDGGKTSADAKFAGAFTGTGVGGVWETTRKDAAGKPLMTLTITAKGQFRLQSAGGWSDHGEVWGHLGMMQMQSGVDRRLVVSRYVLKSLSVMTTTGALGEHEWQRTGPAPAE